MLREWNRQVDLIGGPIMKNLLIFMLPILVSYIFQQLYNAVDTAIVGHFLGEQSLAAVGANVAIFDLMVMFAQALGNGLCIVVSRAYGAGDESRMRKSVAGSLVIGAGTIAVMTALSLLGLGPLLRILGTPEAIYAEALAYIRIIGSWTVVMFAYNFLSSLLRAIGNSAMTLVFLIISSVLNVILDLALVAGAGMGVRGAAAATVIAQGVSAVLSIADAFITHCGMNSASEGLYYQVPLVLFPQTPEQGAVARRVEELGAGIRLKSIIEDDIIHVLKKILSEPVYKENARRVSESFRVCGGAAEARAFLESLVENSSLS